MLVIHGAQMDDAKRLDFDSGASASATGLPNERNPTHHRIKILYWDGTGLWVLSKRLEKGTFSWPRIIEPGRTKLSLRAEALAMLTDGVDLRGGKLRPWYQREE